MKTVTVEKKSLKSKKKDDGIDWDLVRQFEDGLEDIKHGRVYSWRKLLEKD